MFTYCVLKCKTQIHFSSVVYERHFYLATIRVKFAVRNGANLRPEKIHDMSETFPHYTKISREKPQQRETKWITRHVYLRY